MAQVRCECVAELDRGGLHVQRCKFFFEGCRHNYLRDTIAQMVQNVVESLHDSVRNVSHEFDVGMSKPISKNFQNL